MLRLDRWAPCPESSRSYVRNEPTLLQAPRPAPGLAWGIVESLRLTGLSPVLSPGAALSLFPVLALPAELPGPCLAPQPWALRAR